jgi:hypothetical protein
MMQGGFLAEELAIERVREPSDGMPVAGVTGCEGPANILPIEAGLDVWVGRDVIRIVVVDEIVVERGQVNGESQDGKEKAKHRRRAESPVPGDWLRRGGFRRAL